MTEATKKLKFYLRECRLVIEVFFGLRRKRRPIISQRLPHNSLGASRISGQALNCNSEKE